MHHPLIHLSNNAGALEANPLESFPAKYVTIFIYVENFLQLARLNIIVCLANELNKILIINKLT